MIVENGADPAANDSTVTAQPTDQTTAVNNTVIDDEEFDADGNPVAREPETEELEWDGKKWVLPKEVTSALKPALLRQADYTRKTQETAEIRRSLEAREKEIKARSEAREAHFKVATKIAALDEQLTPYKDVNWPTAYQQAANLAAQGDQTAINNYHQHKAVYDQLMNDRSVANREFSDLENKRQQDANRESGERLQKAQAEIARHLPEWTPGGELDMKLLKYGTEQLKIPAQDLGEAAILIPQLVKELNRLRLYDEDAAKKQTQQTFEQQQAAKPVTRVGGGGGSAQRKTTDSSGDALSAEEWAKRERERVRKKA